MRQAQSCLLARAGRDVLVLPSRAGFGDAPAREIHDFLITTADTAAESLRARAVQHHDEPSVAVTIGPIASCTHRRP